MTPRSLSSQTKDSAPDDPHTALVERACRLLEASEQPIPLAVLAKAVGLSPHHFHRVFVKTLGLTPKAFAAACRAGRMRETLTREPTITGALYEAGYSSSSRFYAEAGARLGMTPRRYRSGGRGETLRFALGECSLGSLLVASSERGVCAVWLGDDPEALARELQDRFPHATLLGADRAYERTVAQVAGLVENPRLGCRLPLDLRGTAFQQRVWRALQDIPPGQTLTYADLARRLGCPQAVRAIGGACAANHIAVAIPCHRVIRIDGGLSGYRWGVERKRALLERERKS